MPKRFWRGKKRLAKKYTHPNVWKLLHEYGVPKIGDVTHDCTGFNEYITQVELTHDPVQVAIYDSRTCRFSSPRFLKKVRSVDLQCYYGPNGCNSVCGCSRVGYQKPIPVEEIKKTFLDWDIPEAREYGFSEETYRIIEALKNGERVFDENGVRI